MASCSSVPAAATKHHTAAPKAYAQVSIRPAVCKAAWGRARRPIIFRRHYFSHRCAAPPQRLQLRASGDAAAEGSGAGASEAEALEAQLRAAAALIADRYIESGQTIALGTGVGIALLLQELAARLESGALSNISVLAASDVTASEAALAGVPQAPADAPAVALMVDQADELAVEAEDGSLCYIIGRQPSPHQQPQLPRTRALAAAAGTVVVLADHPSVVLPRLGGAVPVVIQGGEAWEDTAEELDDIFLGDAEVWRRSTQPDAGPRGGEAPYVSPDGENILDIRFDEGLVLFGEEASYQEIAAQIESVPGVVAHGLCVDVAAAAVVASPEGPLVLQRGAAAAHPSEL